MSDEDMDSIVWCRVVMTLVVVMAFFFFNVKGILFPVLGMVSILELSYSGYFNPPNQISTNVLAVTGGQVLQLRHYLL